MDKNERTEQKQAFTVRGKLHGRYPSPRGSFLVSAREVRNSLWKFFRSCFAAQIRLEQEKKENH